MNDTVESIVIGAGVIGLAIAQKLARQGREVLVLEEADAIGTVTSARNSEVIHAGIYYPKNSLKARFCVRGRGLLYRYLEERGIEHKRCGKLVVATDEAEEAALAGILAKAHANGVDDMMRISGEDARAMEPHLNCRSALLSPATGILDTHGYMLSLQGDLESAGGIIAFLSSVTGGRLDNEGFVLNVRGTDGEMELGCRTLINSAGLGAQPLARFLQGFPANKVPPLHFAKGNYFTLSGKAPFEHLIYPVPNSAGLGTHYTCDLGGQGRFGPDVEWVDAIDYTVDPSRGDGFYAAIRQYWPGLPDASLVPGYCGIRPKVQAPGDPAADFILQGPADHGIPGLINLFGIESPGLTSSLAIADDVAARL